MTADSLDVAVRRDLRGLQKDAADSVARHLVAAGMLVDDDPALALEHARFARRRASRIAVVREAAGIAAYHAGEWAEALGDLRAARRMGGGPDHLAVMADIERALGRPERALELARDPEAAQLDRGRAIELAIVAAGARRDLGELDAAVVALQIPELDERRRDPWSARLFYAYADNLLAAGREADAVQWFVHAADADEDEQTDAGERLAALSGDPVPDILTEELAPADVPGEVGVAADAPAAPDAPVADDGVVDVPGAPAAHGGVAEAGAPAAVDNGVAGAPAAVDVGVVDALGPLDGQVADAPEDAGVGEAPDAPPADAPPHAPGVEGAPGSP